MREQWTVMEMEGRGGEWRSLLSPMSSGRIHRIPTEMSEFHGILTESIWLEPQPFWFSIPWNFQQNPTESSGISWNLGASGNGFHWNPLEFPYFGEFQWIPTHSNTFQWIPMFAFVTIIIYKKVHEQGLNHSLCGCHMHRKQQYIHLAIQLL